MIASHPRIAIDLSPLRGTPAGVGLYVALLAQGLVDAGANPAFIGLRDDAAFPTGLPRVTTRPFSGISSHIWTQLAADGQARSTGAQLVHYTNAAAPLVSHLPHVVTVHDLSVMRMPLTHPVRRWPVVLVNVASFAMARVIIVPSRFTARELAHLGVDERRVVVIPHAPALPDADASAASETLARWELERGRYVLYIGTLEPRKNIERLVEAFERVAPDRPGLQLVLAGAPGWRYARIDRRIEASPVRDRIVLTGYTRPETLSSLVANCAAVAYVSLYEGFGMPVLDAMALGAAVVTSNRTATVEAAGGAAALVDPYDVADIARGISRVLQSPDEFRARSVARAGTRTWTDVAREHLDAYRYALTRA